MKYHGLFFEISIVKGVVIMDEMNSYIALLIQAANRIFCYFNLSKPMINRFNELHGDNSWTASKPVLKVFFTENGVSKLQETINIDPLANNWYINLTEADKDIYVEYGRCLNTQTYYPIIVSNTITTPRNHRAKSSPIYYINLAAKESTPTAPNTLEAIKKSPEIEIAKDYEINLLLEEYIKKININDIPSSH
jgi:hypothetical protein